MLIKLRDDKEFLTEALNELNQELEMKEKIWTSGQSFFSNFEMAQELGVDPIIYGLIMCNLKMNRLKSCIARKADHNDKDLYDSLLDLASYATLTRALLKRTKDRKKNIQDTPKSVSDSSVLTQQINAQNAQNDFYDSLSAEDKMKLMQRTY